MKQLFIFIFILFFASGIYAQNNPFITKNELQKSKDTLKLRIDTLKNRQIWVEDYRATGDSDVNVWDKAVRAMDSLKQPLYVGNKTYNFTRAVVFSGAYFRLIGVANGTGGGTIISNSTGFAKITTTTTADLTYPNASNTAVLSGCAFYFTANTYYPVMENIQFSNFRFAIASLSAQNSPTFKNILFRNCNAGVIYYQGSQNVHLINCKADGNTNTVYISSATCFPTGTPYASQDNFYTDGFTAANEGDYGSFSLSSNAFFDTWFTASILRPAVASISTSGNTSYVYPFTSDTSRYVAPSGYAIYIPMRNQRWLFGVRLNNLDVRYGAPRGLALINDGIVGFQLSNLSTEGMYNGVTDTTLAMVTVGSVYSGTVSNNLDNIGGSIDNNHALLKYTTKGSAGQRAIVLNNISSPVLTNSAKQYYNGYGNYAGLNQDSIVDALNKSVTTVTATPTATIGKINFYNAFLTPPNTNSFLNYRKGYFISDGTINAPLFTATRPFATATYVGNSFGQAFGLTNTTFGYVNKSANYFGWSFTNNTITGSTILAASKLFPTTVTEVNVIQLAENDYRQYNTTGMASWANQLQKMIVDRECNSVAYGQTLTYSGTDWSNDSVNFAANIGIKTTVNSSPATYTGYGTAIYVAVKRVAAGSSYSITIDGVSQGTFSADTTGIGGYPVSGQNSNSNFVPYLHRFTVSAGKHAVVIQKTSGTTALSLIYVATNYNPKRAIGTNAAVTYVISPARMTTGTGGVSGYAFWGGNDAVQAAYKAAQQTAVTTLAGDGLQASIVDIDKYYDPNETGMVQSDSLHPTDAGQTRITYAIMDAVTSTTNRERQLIGSSGSSTTLTDNLTTSSTGTALDAHQGYVLKGLVDANTTNIASNTTAITGKQATLVSATNIKTINGTSLLGSGDITIAGGGGSGTIASTSNVLKGDGAGNAVAATAGTDYVTPGGITTALGYTPAVKPTAASVSGADVTTTSITASDITGMSIAVAANKKYRITVVLYTGCSGTGGVKVGINAPSGAAVLSGQWLGFNGNATTIDINRLVIGLASNKYNTVANGNGSVQLIGYFTTSSTAGNVTIQFGAGTAGETSTIFQGSTFDLTEEQ